MKALSAKASYCSLLLGFVIMLLASESALAQFRGKMFTTPEERAYLDALRQDFLKKTQDRGFDIEEAEPPPLPATEETSTESAAPIEYTLGGIMTRSDGSRTVWLNNQPVAESDLPSNMRLVTAGRVVVLRIAVGTTRYQLRPGQTLNASTGKVQEAYQRLPVAANPSSDAAEATTTEQLPVSLEPDALTPASSSPEAPVAGETSEAP